MEKMLTVPEVAQALRVSVRTVYNVLDAGGLREVRFGKTRRIPESALAELVSAGTRAPVFVLEMLAGSGRTWSVTAHRTLEGAQAEAERRASGSLGTGSDAPHEPVTWALDADAPGGSEWAGTIGGQSVARIREQQLRD